MPGVLFSVGVRSAQPDLHAGCNTGYLFRLFEFTVVN